MAHSVGEVASWQNMEVQKNIKRRWETLENSRTGHANME